jgi:electron transfer flavoprotein alpha subunit
MNTWVYIDQYKGEALPASWEAIGVGKSLGTVSALVFGSDVEAIAKSAFEYGAEEVLLVDDPALKDYRVEVYASNLSKLAAEQSPDLILIPTTTRGRELAGMAAIDLNTGVLVDVIALETEGDKILATRPVYAGKLLEKTVCNAKPQIVTLRGRAFPKPEQKAGASGTLTKVEAVTEAKTNVEGYASTESGVSLTDAGVIVSGGRGTSNNPALTPPDGMDEKEAEIWKAQEGFNLVGALAKV